MGRAWRGRHRPMAAEMQREGCGPEGTFQGTAGDHVLHLGLASAHCCAGDQAFSM